MSKFITNVLDDLSSKQLDYNKCVFVLPSKRACTVLLNEISKTIKQVIFAPKAISIEEFINELSDIKPIHGIELIFEFYNVYKETHKENKNTDTFDQFFKWGQLLLQDFNEIDRYVVEPKHIFDYISAIQEINHWSLNKANSTLIKNHLNFWKQLKVLYKNLSEKLLQSKTAYQGLIYREAVSNLEAFTEHSQNYKYIFLGFNALNTAESLIIQDLLNKDKAIVYWDIDNYFNNHSSHNVSQFIKQYQSNWSFYKKNPFLFYSNNYLSPKNVSVIGVPKMIGQAKTISSIISDFSAEKLKKTAIVLGEEQLLEPLLNSLPCNIDKVNITMGLPLKNTPMASLFHQWMDTQIKRSKKILL